MGAAEQLRDDVPCRQGRPPFIPRDAFREWMKPARMRTWFRIDGILPCSYINRSDRLGCPVRHRAGQGSVKLYRPLDVVAHGRGRGLLITESAEQSVARKLTAAEEKLRAMNEQIAAKQHALEQSVLSRQVTDAYMLSAPEIVAQSHDYQDLCGVYFLISDGEIVYVGQSVNVCSRIAQHRNSGKEFERYAWIACDREQLDVLESLYIHVLRPPLNFIRSGPSAGRPGAPLRLDQIALMAATSPLNGLRG